MATNNDIKYISFTFEHEEQSNISPFDVEVEITVLDQYKIAEYKFNSSIDTLFSEVNDGFVYTHNDIDNGDGTITRTIYSDQLPTIIRFEDCEGLLELLYLNTSELTTLRNTFKNCYNVTSINTTDWDTSNVTDMASIFEYCESLTSLNISNWDLNKASRTTSMFYNCTSLTSILMNNSDYNSVNKIIAELPDRSVSNIDLSQINVMQANEKNWRVAGDANGTLDITGVDDINQVNIADAEAKNWVVIPSVQIEEPIPVEKIIALRPISANEDSGYNNKWTNVANTYDTSTSTNGTIIVTGSSQSGFKRAYVDTVFNFDNPIPMDAIITKAVLTIRAQQSATTNLYLNVDVNGDSSKRIINNTLLSQSAKDYTVDVADIIKDLNNLKLNLTSAATSNRTFTLYDIRVDVEYTVYETPTYYDVVFVDFDGTILKSDRVLEGESATAPANPSRNGFIFIGWDKTFDIITGDITITALYEEIVPDDDKEFVNAFNIGNEALQQMFIGGDSIVKIYIGDHLIYGYKE